MFRNQSPRMICKQQTYQQQLHNMFILVSDQIHSLQNDQLAAPCHQAGFLSRLNLKLIRMMLKLKL